MRVSCQHSDFPARIFFPLPPTALRAVRDLETQPFSADTVIVTWKLPTKLDEAIKGFRVFVSDQLPVPEVCSVLEYVSFAAALMGAANFLPVYKINERRMARCMRLLTFEWNLTKYQRKTLLVKHPHTQ